MKERINVTKPYLPPLEGFIPYLEEIWQEKWLTNNGKYHKQLEDELARKLGVEFISLFSNGTLALITALQALNISGEVITTPFSFVATSHSLWWNNIKPVFVDIQPTDYNIDPKKIEAAITPRTTAILAVHVYGNPADVSAIQDIAETYGLRVIYDAAHTFDVRINDLPVLSFGDMSVLSFHATKVFTTFEGGAIVSKDAATKKRIDYLKNFGFAGETTVVAPGINAKMNEFSAALGLYQLGYVDEAIRKRQLVSEIYDKELSEIEGIILPHRQSDVKACYSYYPIRIMQNSRKSRDEVYEELKKYGIHTRRYFYPLISNLPTYRGLDSSKKDNLPLANEVADTILCLPLYSDIGDDAIKVVNALKSIFQK